MLTNHLITFACKYSWHCLSLVVLIQLYVIKHWIMFYDFVSLSRFHNISMKLEDVETIEEIQMLVHDLKRDMSLLSVSNSQKFEVKSLLSIPRICDIWLFAFVKYFNLFWLGHQIPKLLFSSTEPSVLRFHT